MTRLQQHLDFGGDCEEAIDLYVSAFDANILSMVRFGETDLPHPESMARKIVSAELAIFGVRLTVCDELEVDPDLTLPIHGIALALPQPAMRQAVSILSGPQPPWTSGDISFAGTSHVEVEDPFGVLWCFWGYLPAVE